MELVQGLPENAWGVDAGGRMRVDDESGGSKIQRELEFGRNSLSCSGLRIVESEIG